MGCYWPRAQAAGVHEPALARAPALLCRHSDTYKLRREVCTVAGGEEDEVFDGRGLRGGDGRKRPSPPRGLLRIARLRIAHAKSESVGICAAWPKPILNGHGAKSIFQNHEHLSAQHTQHTERRHTGI